MGKTGSPSSSSQLYCVCQSTEDDGFMVECDHCNEWYHGLCVNISAEDVYDDTEFICVMCSETKRAELIYSIQYLRVKYSKSRKGHADDWLDPQVPAFLQPSFCTCYGRDDGRALLLCGICQEWYHAGCVGLDTFIGEFPPFNHYTEQDIFAFVCCRCSGKHQIVGEDEYFTLCDNAPRRVMCKEKSELESTNQSNSPHSILSCLQNREMGWHKKTRRNNEEHIFSGIQWQRLETLEILDMAAWSNVAPWVLRSSPNYPVIAVGTNVGTIELLSPHIKRDISYSPLQPKNALAEDVGRQHLGVITTGLDDISALEWSSDSSMIAAGTWLSGSIVLCDIQTGKTVREYINHKALVRSLHVPNNIPHIIISSSHDKTVCIHDCRGQDYTVLDGHVGRVVGAQAVWPYIITSASDSTVRVWDIRQNDKCIGIVTTPSPITSLDISSDHRRVAINTVPGSILLFNTTDLLYSCTQSNTTAHYLELLGHVNKFWCTGRAYFSPDCKAIATGSEDSCTVVWNITGNSPTLSYRSKTNTHWVWDVAWFRDFSGESLELINCSEDRTIAILGYPFENIHHPSWKEGIHVLARWQDSRYYHAITDGEIGGMCHVKFRGWHGPDSRALYEPASLLRDFTYCSCKRGHFAADVPSTCVPLLDSPCPLPPSPSIPPLRSTSPDSPIISNRSRGSRLATIISSLSPSLLSLSPSNSILWNSTPPLYPSPLSLTSPLSSISSHFIQAQSSPSLPPNVVRRLSFSD